MLLTGGLNAYQKLTEEEFCFELAVRCTSVEGSAAHRGARGSNAYQKLTAGEFSFELAARCAGVERGADHWGD